MCLNNIPVCMLNTGAQSGKKFSTGIEFIISVSLYIYMYIVVVRLDIIVMGTIWWSQGPRYSHFVSWSLKREMKVKDTNHHVASVDHVKMNSWCKFGECSTNNYCNMDLTISS